VTWRDHRAGRGRKGTRLAPSEAVDGLSKYSWISRQRSFGHKYRRAGSGNVCSMCIHLAKSVNSDRNCRTHSQWRAEASQSPRPVSFPPSVGFNKRREGCTREENSRRSLARSPRACAPSGKGTLAATRNPEGSCPVLRNSL